MARPIKNVALGLLGIMTEAISLGHERRNASLNEWWDLKDPKLWFHNPKHGACSQKRAQKKMTNLGFDDFGFHIDNQTQPERPNYYKYLTTLHFVYYCWPPAAEPSSDLSSQVKARMRQQ